MVIPCLAFGGNSRRSRRRNLRSQNKRKQAIWLPKCFVSGDPSVCDECHVAAPNCGLNFKDLVRGSIHSNDDRTSKSSSNAPAGAAISSTEGIYRSYSNRDRRPQHGRILLLHGAPVPAWRMPTVRHAASTCHQKSTHLGRIVSTRVCTGSPIHVNKRRSLWNGLPPDNVSSSSQSGTAHAGVHYVYIARKRSTGLFHEFNLTAADWRFSCGRRDGCTNSIY